MDFKILTKHLKKLIDLTEMDLVRVWVQQHIFENEAKNPVYISKEKAEENMKIYEQRAKNIEANLEAFRIYAKANEIKL